MSSSGTRRRLVVLAALALTASACSSTTKTTPGDPASQEAPSTEPAGEAALEAPEPGARARQGAAEVRDTGRVDTRPAAAGARGGSRPIGKLPARHRAVTATTVRVGFNYLANAGTVATALGVEGYTQGDEPGEFQALVDDLNRRGGIAGRKVVADKRDVGSLDESAYESACTYFTQDRPVFMVFSVLGHSTVFSSCLAKADVGFTSDSQTPSDREMRSLGPVYSPDGIAIERYAALIGRSQVDNGFFTRGAKVGIWHEDTPDYARVTKDILRPRLRRAGVSVAHEEKYSFADNSYYANGPGVVFRMRAAGVTHVVTYDTPLFLMIAAESQNWRPWWTVTSRAGAGSFLEGAAPRGQLPRAMGPGWMQTSDIASSRIKKPFNKAEARCLEIMAKANYRAEGTPRLVMETMCGMVFHFERVMSRAGEFSTAGFRTSAERLTGHESPLTFGAEYPNRRHDGASKYRFVKWNAGCSCFAYTPGLKQIPNA